MHGVNLDLLRATSVHDPDGRPKDAHAHHRVELRAIRKAERAARWQGAIARIVALARKTARRQAKVPSTFP